MPFLFVLFLPLLFAGSWLSRDTRYPVGMLLPGTYWSIDVHVEDGVEWLGVYSVRSGLEVRESIVRIESFTNAEYGIEQKKVYAEGAQQPLLLIERLPVASGRHATSMVEGEILITAEPNSPFRLTKDEVTLLADRSQLAGEWPDPSTIGGRYTLRLSDETRGEEQILLVIEEGDYEHRIPRLFWAGDLEGDTRLDVLLELGEHGEEEYVLFLSSLAAPGDVVGEAGRFHVTGE